ncbi:MAG: cobalamin biosynthesis protein P47K [Oscillospiraceae bacterium]|jgi:G3E family GTPase|nr:cobalamin biosynthesis protein P47K [Oscillospiraceae bacterium]
MKIIILGGFLGSGKTTALLRFAKYLVDSTVSDKDTKVMILENEVGEVGIDDKFLRAGGLSVSNLFSGCACCTMSGELTSVASVIQRDYDPEWLVIETTGVAYPLSMQENLLSALKINARICVLVDAKRWPRLINAMRGLLAGQIWKSDAVFINKVDLVDEETLGEIEADILELEPNAKIFRISALSEVPDEVWRTAAGV